MTNKHSAKSLSGNSSGKGVGGGNWGGHWEVPEANTAIPQEKKRRLLKYPVENRLTIDTTFTIGHSLLVVSISRAYQLRGSKQRTLC